MATRVECPHCGKLVYPDGAWCPECGESVRPEAIAPDEPITPPDAQPQVQTSATQTQPALTRVSLPAGFWLLAIIAVLILFWAAAESHDQGCYAKTAAQVASGNTAQSNCLILPWNDPVTKQERNNRFGY